MRTLARQALEDLRVAAGANNITCHFSNPFSKNLWLLERAGSFRHEDALHGPLTLKGQKDRMDVDQAYSIKTDDPETTFDHYPDVPERLSANVLAGPSFVTREGIERCIRVRMTNLPLGVVVIIFLNYRVGADWPSAATFAGLLNQKWRLLRLVLEPLVQEPRLDYVAAWKLRSVVTLLQREIARPLESKTCLTELYQEITKRTFELIKPETQEGWLESRNVICTLHKVNTSNDVELLASYPRDPQAQSGGIVDYVAHTGLVYMVNDIAAYRRTQSDDARPPYAEFHPASRAGIACPLIVKDRVIGVLDLEADQPNAFTETQLLMLWQLAGVAALAVRQGAFREASTGAVEMQQRQLICNDEPAVFLELAKHVRTLGFEAAIWDRQRGQWHSDRPGVNTDPRPQGYTNEVATRKNPLVLADLRHDPRIEGGIDGRVYAGSIDHETGLFAGWDPQPLELQPLNGAHKQYVTSLLQQGSSWNVVTDLALPILQDPTDTSSEVVAVLWATTRRHYQSLLDDDIWRLSALCKQTSVSLKVFHEKKQRLDLVGQTRTFMLDYHFGTHGEAVGGLLDRDNTVLSPQASDKTIVVNIDMKGSTKLARECASRGKLAEYVRFVAEYQEQARLVTRKCEGVFDKTMGDGVHILFNAYQGPLAGVSTRSLQEEQVAAVKCAFAIFETFRAQVDRYFVDQRVFGFPAKDLVLSAGVGIGAGLVGSFEKGLDFTVLGDVANRAAKLVPLARGDRLRENLETDPQSWRIMRSGKRDLMTKAELEELRARLQQQDTSFLLCDWEISASLSSNPYQLYELPEVSGGIYPVLVLPKLDS